VENKKKNTSINRSIHSAESSIEKTKQQGLKSKTKMLVSISSLVLCVALKKPGKAGGHGVYPLEDGCGVGPAISYNFPLLPLHRRIIQRQ
jgi:hypothetical protein